MTDEAVEDLLNSSEPLAVIEAPAGCGKTYQGARYA
jgi:DNA helicase-2/ATP-dependent DNA helicase PcrA